MCDYYYSQRPYFDPSAPKEVQYHPQARVQVAARPVSAPVARTLPSYTLSAPIQPHQLKSRPSTAAASRTAPVAPEPQSSAPTTVSRPASAGPTAQAPPPPKRLSDKYFGVKSCITSEFFSNGSSRFRSENGLANAMQYYQTQRPLGARMHGSHVSKTTPHGYLFDCYTKLR